jgi:hypothetical protein
MTSAAFSLPSNQNEKISVRRRGRAPGTGTALAADEAIQKFIDKRRLKHLYGGEEDPRYTPVDAVLATVNESISRFGLGSWLARAVVLVGVGVLLAVAAVHAMPTGTAKHAVAGSVSLGGKPLAQAVLVLHGNGESGPVSVTLDTNDQGRFSRPASVGLPAGSYAVVIKSGCVMPSPTAERGVPVKIPAKYTNVVSTPLRLEVAEESSSVDLVLRE